jgi:hypothetical protein
VCLAAVAKKGGESEKSWWAWVPVLQVLLILRVAKIDWWWIFFFLIPFVNIAIAIYIWVRVAKTLGKHPVWGVLMVVPGLDLFVLADKTPVYNDCGIVYVPKRPYILCMMVAADEDTARNEMIAYSKMTYSYVSQVRADQAHN